MPGIKGQHRKHFNTAGARARSRAWASMRIQPGGFTMPWLMSVSDIGKDNVWAYLKRLIAAGYVTLAAPKQNGYPGSFNTYRLTRNTGPKAPIPWATGEVFDPNNQTIYGKE